MDYKSQNNEVKVVLDYFNGRIGALLSLGENNGQTFSNSFDLIKLGWYAVLVEPDSGAFTQLQDLYKDSDKVSCFNIGIGTKSGKQTFYEVNDSLISTTNKDLLKGWNHIQSIKDVKVDFYSWAGVKLLYPVFGEKFEFITIDCEGMDFDILQQMNLNDMGCECICIEYSNNNDLYIKIRNYCKQFGFIKELLRNGENIILVK